MLQYREISFNRRVEPDDVDALGPAKRPRFARGSYKQWTKDEDAIILREAKLRRPTCYTAEKINRSEWAVLQRLEKLGFRRQELHPVREELCMEDECVRELQFLLGGGRFVQSIVSRLFWQALDYYGIDHARAPEIAHSAGLQLLSQQQP